MSEHFITYEQMVRKTVRKTVRIELKHCPFCGGEAEFRIGGNWNPRLDQRMGTGVRCKGCKVVTPVRQGYDSQLRAAELWNRRAEA